LKGEWKNLFQISLVHLLPESRRVEKLAILRTMSYENHVKETFDQHLGIFPSFMKNQVTQRKNIWHIQ